MRKDVMMISAGLMMLAMASCDQTEYREITEDRVVPQPVDTIKVADHFYLDGYLSRTSEDIGGRQLNAVNLFSDGEELYVANFVGKCIDVFDAETLELMYMPRASISSWQPATAARCRSSRRRRASISAVWAPAPGQPAMYPGQDAFAPPLAWYS